MTDTDGQALQFRFIVDDVFHFQDGSTVFVGTTDKPEQQQLIPATAEVQVEETIVAHVHLTEERMPGPAGRSRRALVTRDKVDLEFLKGRSCVLLCRR